MAAVMTSTTLQHGTTLTLSSRKFLWIRLMYSWLHIHTQHVLSFLVWWSIPLWSTWQKWFPADAAQSFLFLRRPRGGASSPGRGGRASAASGRTHLLMSQSVRQTAAWVQSDVLPLLAFNQLSGRGGGNRKASCISPSILLQSSLIFSSIPTESLHVYSYVLHLSLFFFFKFSAFSIPRWGNAISTHTRLMCYTPASQLHSRSQSLNKSPPPLPTMPDGVICARWFH